MTEETTRYFISDIIAHTSEVFKVPTELIIGRSRKRVHTRPRVAVAFLSRKLTPLSLPQIGKHMDGRDHSTVMSAVGRAAVWMTFDPLYKLAIEEIEARVKQEPGAAERLALQRVKEAAERVSSIAAEKAEREHWMRMAGGNKAYATVLRKRAQAAGSFICHAKPKNNFNDTENPDDGHDFQAMMARGSADLLAALQAA